MSGFVRSIKMSHCGNDETEQNALCGRYLNNRRTGKDATKPRTLGLLGHSELTRFKQFILNIYTLGDVKVILLRIGTFCIIIAMYLTKQLVHCIWNTK